MTSLLLSLLLLSSLLLLFVMVYCYVFIAFTYAVVKRRFVVVISSLSSWFLISFLFLLHRLRANVFVVSLMYGLSFLFLHFKCL